MNVAIDTFSKGMKRQCALICAMATNAKYLLFDENSSAQMHCQMGGYATAAEYIFDLLEEKLKDI